MNKRFSAIYFGTFANTPENHDKIKNLSKALRATGVKFRMFRYGRGKNRKSIWEKQVAYSLKTGKGWEGQRWLKYPNHAIWNRNSWRPRLMFCERFDVYLDIQIQTSIVDTRMTEWREKYLDLRDNLQGK